MNRHASGLPFYDVILLDNLPKSASLPVGTVQATKKRIQSGYWKDFDYIFFTESDQVILGFCCISNGGIWTVTINCLLMDRF